jgi:signal transduction histidine kinase
MSLVKEIMDIHQGSVEIESEPNHGTQVSLWLPTAENASVSNSPTAAGKKRPRR